MLDSDEELVIHGKRALYKNATFSAQKIRLLDSFSNQWEKSFYRAQLKNMPDGVMIEEPMPEKTTIIYKSRENPYWLEIYTTEEAWSRNLIGHKFAVVKLAHTWPTGEVEHHYILPSILLSF